MEVSDWTLIPKRMQFPGQQLKQNGSYEVKGYEKLSQRGCIQYCLRSLVPLEMCSGIDIIPKSLL